MVIGIDTSHHNSDEQIEKAVAKHNAKFIVMKATEGRTFTDKEFKRRVDEYREKFFGEEFLIGAYHYARPRNGNTAESEAANFLSAIKPFEGVKMLLMLDVEGVDADRRFRDWYEKWLDIVYEASGIRPLIYTSESKVTVLPPFIKDKYGLWVAKWSENNKAVDVAGNITIWNAAKDLPAQKPSTANWDTFALWQFNVDRELNIDLDAFNGTFANLKKYAVSDRFIEMEEITETTSCKCGCTCRKEE